MEKTSSSIQNLKSNNQYQWHKLGITGPVSFGSICEDPFRDLYGAINYNPPNTQNLDSYLARYNSTKKNWKSLGGNFNDTVMDICSDSNGNIYAVGAFTNTKGSFCLKQYIPTTKLWNDLGGTFNAQLNNVCIDSNNNVYVIGNFTNVDNNQYVAQFNPTTKVWSELSGLFGGLTGSISGICCDPSNNIYIVGVYLKNGDAFAAKWSGTQWDLLSSHYIGSAATVICSDPSGNIYIPYQDPTTLNYFVAIMSKDGTWSKTGEGYSSKEEGPMVIYSDSFGNIYYGGNFVDTKGGSFYIAQYNSQNNKWSVLCGPNSISGVIDGSIMNICSPKGSSNIYASGALVPENNFVALGKHTS